MAGSVTGARAQLAHRIETTFMSPLTTFLSSLCLLASSAAFAQAPNDFEMELWRSATRLDTPAAYEAYLKSFPQGSFAAMAQAALARPPPRWHRSPGR
jgi:hypothetical protein